MSKILKKSSIPQKSSLTQKQVQEMQVPRAVIGNGLSALLALSLTAKKGHKVVWMPGTGSKVLSPLPSVSFGEGAFYFNEILKILEVPVEEPTTGCFVREFKNKAFKMPAWDKVRDASQRIEAFEASTGGAEWTFSGQSELKWNLSLFEIEEFLRVSVSSNSLIFKLEHPSIIGLSATQDDKVNITFGSGEEFSFQEVIYADRWAALAGVKGVPKATSFLRGRDAVGVLQATFKHADFFSNYENNLTQIKVSDGFFGTLHREAGDKIDHRIWGYFIPDQHLSVWTTILEVDEGEDNHEIAKKLRRIKQALEKMFGQTPGWLPEGTKDFASTILDESVRFEEGVIFSAGNQPKGPLKIPGMDRLSFITDGYGPCAVALILKELFGDDYPELNVEPTQFLESLTERAESHSPAKPIELLGAAQP